MKCMRDGVFGVDKSRLGIDRIWLRNENELNISVN